MAGKRGQPTKYHDERCDTILQSLRQGNTLKTAALMGGIHYDTLNEWRKKHPDFSEAVEKAEAEAESLHVINIRTHSADNWQASAWWLERRRHGDWRKRDSVSVGNEGDESFRVAVDDSEREAKLAAFLARLGEGGAGPTP